MVVVLLHFLYFLIKYRWNHTDEITSVFSDIRAWIAKAFNTGWCIAQYLFLNGILNAFHPLILICVFMDYFYHNDTIPWFATSSGDLFREIFIDQNLCTIQNLIVPFLSFLFKYGSNFAIFFLYFLIKYRWNHTNEIVSLLVMHCNATDHVVYHFYFHKWTTKTLLKYLHCITQYYA